MIRFKWFAILLAFLTTFAVAFALGEGSGKTSFSLRSAVHPTRYRGHQIRADAKRYGSH